MTSLLPHTFKAGKLVWAHRRVPTAAEMRCRIEALPVVRDRQVLLYKQFFRLRRMIGGKAVYSEQEYLAVLRRSFRTRDFALKRSVFLPGCDPLGEAEFTRRQINTLAFVFNATVSSSYVSPDDGLYYQKDKNLGQTTVEQQVVRTILEMNHQMPASIRYDRKFEWTRNIAPDNAVAIGYWQYETTLMRLNETMGLCL